MRVRGTAAAVTLLGALFDLQLSIGGSETAAPAASSGSCARSSRCWANTRCVSSSGWRRITASSAGNPGAVHGVAHDAGIRAIMGLMAKLIYSVIASLDGYVADADGNFDWAAPDEEVHAFVNDLERSIGTYLYGRRMYETMVFWENPPGLAEQPPTVREFARIWQAADKIVYSRTLQTATSARTRIEREFDPDAVRELKARAARDLTVGGAELANRAIAAGLVDEYELFLVPVLVGGGKRALPDDHLRVNLELLDERRFRNGTIYLHYRVVS
jgi:dihydrofolate reductase